MGSESVVQHDPEQPMATDEANNLHQQSERRPFPTDSMVTVRLSEMSIPPPTDALAVVTPVPPYRNPLLESKGTGYLSEGKNGDTYTPDGKILFSTNTASNPSLERESTASSISIADEQQTETRLSNLRSESKSRGSFSSVSSTHFDWDELDKSEEQVPRDEESDEVCSLWDA